MIHYCTEHLLNQQFILRELLRSFRKSIKKVHKYVSKLYFLPLRNIFVTNCCKGSILLMKSTVPVVLI